MRRRSALWALCLWSAATGLGAGGCAYFSKNASVRAAVGPGGVAERAGRVAVPVFVQEKYKAGKSFKRWANSPVTDRFVAGLLQQGYTVVDRSVVQKALTINGIYSNGILREDDISKIGKLLRADVVVFGKLTLVEQADGRILSRKVTARGVRVSNGRTVFSLSAVDTTMYRVLSGEDLVDQILAEMSAVAENVEPGEEQDASEDAPLFSDEESAAEDVYADSVEPARNEAASDKTEESPKEVEASSEGAGSSTKEPQESVSN